MGSKEAIIKKVENNYEKKETYAREIEKYKAAIKNEFYLEALVIVYAMLEDRLNSFLYHSGCCNRELKITKKFKNEIKDIWGIENEQQKISMKKISIKYNYIRNMLEWAENSCKDNESEFELLLKSKIEGIDIGLLRESIDNLEKWCAVRNEIIHGLLNKNYIYLDKQLKEYAEEGYRIARDIDSVIKMYKRNDNIRRKFNIQ